MMPEVPFIKPKFPNPDDIAHDLESIYKNNYYSNNGPFYHDFKTSLEKYLGQGIQAVVVSNATLGLMMAIEAVFGQYRRQRKYIAIPSFTFAAGPLAVKWCGFEPLFFDIDANTSQPDISSFYKALQKYGDDIAGVVLINNFGIGNTQIYEWDQLLTESNLTYIVDSAPGFGSTYANNELLGGYGECEVFSFHATKPFGIGEGGLITTKNNALAKKLEEMKNFGFDENKTSSSLGTNAKITELDCAIGLRVLAGYNQTLLDRRSTYNLYADNLKGKVEFLPRAETAAIQFASIVVKDRGVRQAILKKLKENGVEARTYYAPAVHTFPIFAQSEKMELNQTDELSSRIISLPVHPNMDKMVIKRICDIITSEL